MKEKDRKALKEWEEIKASILNATTIDSSLSPYEIEKKRQWLEAHPIEWMKYFFPHYAKCEFADFQRKAIKRLIDNPEWYEVLSWSRELAKSTIVMMITLYLVLTGRKKMVILAAATQDAAIRLLAPYKINLESNQRLIQFYGEQETFGDWSERQFKLKCGAAFLGISRSLWRLRFITTLKISNSGKSRSRFLTAVKIALREIKISPSSRASVTPGTAGLRKISLTIRQSRNSRKNTNTANTSAE